MLNGSAFSRSNAVRITTAVGKIACKTFKHTWLWSQYNYMYHYFTRIQRDNSYITDRVEGKLFLYWSHIIYVKGSYISPLLCKSGMILYFVYLKVLKYNNENERRESIINEFRLNTDLLIDLLIYFVFWYFWINVFE